MCRAAGGSRALRFLKDSFCPQINHGNQKSGSLDTRTDNHFDFDMVRKAAFGIKMRTCFSPGMWVVHPVEILVGRGFSPESVNNSIFKYYFIFVRASLVPRLSHYVAC